MSTAEKIYCLFAIFFAFALLLALLLFPELRRLNLLLPAGLAGVTVNIGLMFLVLRDILMRRFDNEASKYLWIAVVLVFWPAILYYLPRHAFTKRHG